MVPSVDWFIYAFVRKEAVLSSQIEGTQATLIDLLAFEAEEQATPIADVEEVCNYLDAITYARGEMASEKGLPLSMRLLNEAHRRLVSGARGANRQPGNVRRSQNWIGGSRPGNAVFVPPPPNVLADLLSALETSPAAWCSASDMSRTLPPPTSASAFRLYLVYFGAWAACRSASTGYGMAPTVTRVLDGAAW